MLNASNLRHPSMQIKLRSARVQAEHLGLVSKTYNSKRRLIIVGFMRAGDDRATFHEVTAAGEVGRDITDMVHAAIPDLPTPKKQSFFGRAVAAVTLAMQTLFSVNTAQTLKA